MGIFEGFGNQKNQESSAAEKNSQKIQRYLNKYHMVSRDLDNTEAMKERDARGTGESAYAWQAYTWIDEATATSDDRTNRYREYREMCKIPELNHGINIYCLHPDTIINTLKGSFTIKELADGVLGKEFEVWSYNIKENKVDIGNAKNPHITLKNADVYKVTFDDGSEIIATDNHPFLLKTGEYKELGRLIPGDRITPFYSREKQDMSDTQKNYSNHKVVSVEYYGKSDVYDMEVEEFHNFNANGVFVHNSDNATQYNINHNVLEIQSDNQKISEVLEKLFFERLDINSNLWGFVKNMCKFGDEFVEVILDSQTAPKNVLSLERIKRPENLKRKEKNNKLERFEYDYSKEEEKDSVKYEPWQVIHFSIDDEQYEPYGKSILEAGRKTFKRLSLMEDAMLVYRISRAPERRVFYIDVGTLSTKDANHYIEQLKRKFKKKIFCKCKYR